VRAEGPTPYSELNAVLQELVESVRAALGNRFVAACLQGSFAVGDFDRHTTLDPSWAGLIDRAWDGRPNPALSVRQPADPADFRSTLEFVRYAIGASTKSVAEW
jgi:hypothetical protein